MSAIEELTVALRELSERLGATWVTADIVVVPDGSTYRVLRRVGASWEHSWINGKAHWWSKDAAINDAQREASIAAGGGR